MRAAIFILAIVAGALAAPAAAEERYQCKCCGEYFGKNPNAPTFWKKTLGLGRLIRNQKYEEVLSRFDDLFRKNDYSISDVGWAGEALFALGALKSGIHDPLQPYRYFQAGKSKDPVADDLQWMHAKYGKKIWDASAIAEYGNAVLCATSELRQANPSDTRLLNRRLSALIVTGHFDNALREVAAVPADSLAYVNDIGEILAKTTQEYIGMARYAEGADYLATLKKVHGLSNDARDHWVARLTRGVEQEPLPPDRKKRLLTKIRAI